MKSEILSLLKNTSDYLSGQKICDTLGVSRTAVWKIIKQLKEEGYVIDSVNNKGYRLLSCPDILSKEEIFSSLELAGTSFVRKIIYLNEVDSTNTRAKLEAENGACDGTLIVADEQTKGKGRRGRSFSSPKGVGIFMTLILKPEILPQKASMLTLIAGLAVCNGIRQVTDLDVKIKWPNDIVYNGKKICGILTEMSAEMDYVNHIVVGIGINVNHSDFPEEIKDVATSLYLETGRTFRRSDLIAAVIKEWEAYYEIFLKTKDLSLLKDDYNSRMINTNKKVLVIRGDDSYEAVARTIDADGELLVEKDGTLVKVMSGEVSVRGVYGYV